MQLTLPFVTLVLSCLAVATPFERRQDPTTDPSAGATSTTTTTSECDTGDAQCCQSLQNPSDPSTSDLLGTLGVVVQGLTAQVGLTCTPISVLAIAGQSCTAQPACCTGDSFNGLVNLACTPIAATL
ncbi:hypothetical protein HYPSUDRAFT_195940 [Hypholoma sublateritium FD-334 SS-4]|uniref:Hydrophobin n=1 Tax=Hypholoma sublateritium (strain FD-334 SS-4) TaxID=945553 RepID=A0A0D2MZI6_HYPSF|nr:hypothetical protein HYPSUDRAFT_195940 [Hypholoma sublateritium FD-334 SS-4]